VEIGGGNKNILPKNGPAAGCLEDGTNDLLLFHYSMGIDMNGITNKSVLHQRRFMFIVIRVSLSV
jgi:hypothetical protein